MEVDKKSASLAGPGALGLRLAELAIFFATSYFDLKKFCNVFTYKNVQYSFKRSNSYLFGAWSPRLWFDF